MRFAILIAALATGCSPIDSGKGRYQAMANTAGAGVYVLDTKTGELRLCMPGPTAKGPDTIGITCMSPSAKLSS